MRIEVRKAIVGAASAVLGVAAVVVVCFPFRERLADSTIALAFMLVVLLVAARWGSWPALLAAVAGDLAFNFFFLPPLFEFTVNDPRSKVALFAFFVTAITAGQLSQRSRRRAAEAEAGKTYARSLIEASLDPLVTISAEGTITDVNDAAVRVTGVPGDELVGTEFSTYFTDPERARDGYKRVFEKGSVTDYALTIRNRVDGRLTDVLYNAAVYRDAGGQVAGVFAAARDVTQRNKAEAELERVNRAHRALSSCNQALIRATDETAWLEQVCRIIVDEAGYRFAWVGRADEDASKSIRPIARAGVDRGYLELAHITWSDEPRGRGPTGTAIREGRPEVVKDFASDPRLAPWREAARERGYASSIAIPLALDAGTGVLTIYSGEVDAFGTREVDLLTELAGDLVYGLGAIRTRAELRALNADLEARVVRRTSELREAHEREAQTGGRIQQMLLLDEPPHDVRGLRVAALTVPSQSVAGDFYGFFWHEESDCLDVLVADVMGKGVPAALLAAATKSYFPEALWHLLAMHPKGTLPDPKDVVTLAHTHMARHLIGLESFVTACYARFDAAHGTLSLVDCGHTGAIHLQKASGRCILLHGENLPLGVREGEMYRQLSVGLDVGDVVLFFSDGVTEARNALGEMFGVDRLLECVGRSAGADPAALVSAVREATASFVGSRAFADDLTCVVVQRLAQEVPIASDALEIRSTLGELRAARAFVDAFCARLDPPLDERARASLVLAVDEAASNVIKHAYAGREDQQIEVAAEAFADRVAIRLRHVGAPFDPKLVPLPSFDGSRESGFGVFLIEKSVDDVRYYRDDLDRRCIRLEKRRAA